MAEHSPPHPRNPDRRGGTLPHRRGTRGVSILGQRTQRSRSPLVGRLHEGILLACIGITVYTLTWHGAVARNTAVFNERPEIENWADPSAGADLLAVLVASVAVIVAMIGILPQEIHLTRRARLDERHASDSTATSSKAELTSDRERLPRTPAKYSYSPETPEREDSCQKR